MLMTLVSVAKALKVSFYFIIFLILHTIPGIPNITFNCINEV